MKAIKNPEYGTFDVRIYLPREDELWWEDNLLDDVLSTPAGVFLDDFSGRLMLSYDIEVHSKLVAANPFHKRDFMAVKIIRPAQGEWYARFLMEAHQASDKKDFRKLRVMRLKSYLERLADDWYSSMGDDHEFDRRAVILGEALKTANEWSDGRFFPQYDVSALSRRESDKSFVLTCL